MSLNLNKHDNVIFVYHLECLDILYLQLGIHQKKSCVGWAGEEVFHHQSSFLSDKRAARGLVLYSRLIFSAAFSVMAERNNGISPGNRGDRGMPIMD